MKDLYCVYKHTAPNGKVYIGQTKAGAQNRWANGKGYTCHRHGWFWKAIEKYGWENIKHEIIYDNLSKELADYYEKFFINLYQSTDKRYGYNCQTGGSRDYKYSDESRKKISEGLKKHYAINGHPFTDKARKALMKRQGRQIVQYDLDGHKIAEYQSAFEASQKTGISNSKINGVVRDPKRNRQTGGFMWLYKEEATETIEPYKKKRPCNQYDLEGFLIRQWGDVKKADKYYSHGKKKRKSAEKCCDGVRCQTAYGYMWKYSDEADEKIEPYQIGKKVLQFDRDGNFIKCWKNTAEIKSVLGWNVKNSCEHRSKTTYGYQWRYEGDETPLLKISNPHIVHKSVQQYSMTGDFIAEYKSVREASDATGVNVNNIQECCYNEKRKATGGYIWKYTNDNYEVTPYKRLRAHFVGKVNKNGVVVKVYNTIKEAAEDNCLSPNSLSHFLRGKQKTLNYNGDYQFVEIKAEHEGSKLKEV